MQPQSIEKGQPVTFKWIDSCSQGGWYSSKVISDPEREFGSASHITSRGFVVRANGKDPAIVISSSLTANQASLDPLEVPWAAITELSIEPII